MRIVFMGTPQFAADILDELARHHDVVCSYTQPDKVRGRGKKLVASPVKSLSEDLGIEVRCPKTLKSHEEIEYLKHLMPDVICVAAYGMILPEEVLEIPEFGCLNVHASLLPKWRGAAPIERAIMAGDEYAGVCIMRMEAGLDTGDWCVCRKIPIGGLRATEVTEELAELGSKALLAALEQSSSGNVRWNSQDDAESTYAPKLERRELWLDPCGSVKDAHRKFLASSASHPSKVSLNGRTCTLCNVAPVSSDECVDMQKNLSFEAGDLLNMESRIFIAFEDGILEVLSLKPDGKSEMDASAYLTGAHLPERSKWQKADQ